MSVSLADLGTVTLNQVKENSSLSLLCLDVELETLVDVYGGMMSKKGTLIHNGDFIKFCDSQTSTAVKYREWLCLKLNCLSPMQSDSVGLLLACFKEHAYGVSYAIVQLLQFMDNLGEIIINEFDCPLLMLSSLVYCVLASHVDHSISVVHECTDSCKYVTGQGAKTIEHENVTISQLSYKHDYSNNMYCFNVYCMNH